MNKPILLLGAPGTGKTQRLISEILNRKPNSFCFVSFTRRAANEAKQRLRQYFTPQQLRYTRTIHSLCFELAGLKKEQVMDDNQIYKFAGQYGYDLHPRRFSYEDGTYHDFMSDDDVEFRVMMIDMAKVDIPHVKDNPLFPAYSKYMRDNHLIDYHMMIALGTEAVTRKYDAPKFDLLLVDEIQDLTPIQLGFIAELRPCCKEVIFAGDDNQMIFEWAGVDRNSFLKLADECEIEYLTINHRLPEEINWLSLKLAARQSKHLTLPTEISHIKTVKSIEYVPGTDLNISSGDKYLILARNNYILDEPTVGMSYMDDDWSWLDEEKDTRIKVSTIHGAKGAEADNVILYTDVSPATYEQLDSDAEHRVWYVAVTRTRKNLFIIQPQTDTFYDLE